MAEIKYINGIADENISKIYGVAKSSIGNIRGLTFPVALLNTLYNFEDQTTQESGTYDWNPSGTHSGWETDVAVVTGGASFGNPASNGNTTTDGWNLGYGATVSGNTGPNGGVHSDLDGTHTATGRYMYIEGTGIKDDRVCVVRSPGINFSTTMGNTSNNLHLKFWVHQYSSNSAGHSLFVYIDDAATSTEAAATLLETTTAFDDGTNGFWRNSTGNAGHGNQGSNWVQHSISLASYRAVDATHYIYFVGDGATSYTSDLSIDNVQFLETE